MYIFNLQMLGILYTSNGKIPIKPIFILGCNHIKGKKKPQGGGNTYARCCNTHLTNILASMQLFQIALQLLFFNTLCIMLYCLPNLHLCKS